MREINKIISLFLVVCILSISVFSAGTITSFAEEATEKQDITLKDDLIENMNSDTDSSELNVRVIRQNGDNKTTVFTGKLKDYDNGRWIHLDFSGIQFFVLLDWDSMDCDGMENEAIYIVPLSNDTKIENNTAVSKPSDETVNETLSSGTAVTSQNSGIQCDVNLMYDGAYSEKVIIRNKQLTVPVKITNNSDTDKNIVCYIAEYYENGVLRNSVSSSTVTVEPGKSIATQVTKVFSSKTKSVKIFVWNSKSLQPITGAITLDESESDYYANTVAEAQEYDIGYQIKGKINTANDVDYIKFIPKASGEYTFNCVSTTNAVITLYNANQGTLKSASTSYKCSLTENQTYYLKVMGNIGDYVLSVQYNVPSEADSFDVYKFDVDMNIYKKSIKETCDSLYYSNEKLSKQMYDEYEDILGDDAKLHKLPDFLSGHPKDLSNFDTLLNQYYATKYSDFVAIRQRYIDLIDKYAELANTSSVSTSAQSDDIETVTFRSSADMQNETNNNENISDNEPYPIIGKYVPQAKQRENVEMGDIRPVNEIQATVTPSLTIVSKTATSVTYNATFPVSGRWGNIIRLIDFNTNNGLTIEKNQYGNDEYRQSGQQTINGLSPGGIYIIGMWWSTDGEWSGGDNSIWRFVQLPNDTTEALTTYSGGRVTAKIESADKALTSDLAFNTWLSRMDKVYNCYKDLTGYTPYNSKKIEMRSTRNNLNDYFDIVDGENYWWVVFGYFDGTNIFKYGNAYYKGLLRRLKSNDWGWLPMHEMSHVFDNYKWNFDSETLAQFKAYYAMEQLNAKVYDCTENEDVMWYTGSEYYDYLKSNRFKESYDNSFGKGIYKSEGFAALLIDIERKTGWSAFKKTFRYFSGLPYSKLPDDDGGTLKLFLTKLKDYSGVDVLSYISSRDTRIIESHFGISLDYVEPVYPTVFGGSGGGGRSEINADKGNYTVFEFKPTESANYYIYTSPYAGSGASNDTYIEVYTNPSLTGEPIASNDDYGGERFSKVSIAMTSGITYHIKIRHYNNGQLHTRINVTRNVPVNRLTENEYSDIIVSGGDFAMFSFTPETSSMYVFEASGYGGSSAKYDTYVKLYDSETMTNCIGHNENKIVTNLTAGHTYYLQFSGFLMQYARGRITVSQGQTLQFTKRTDSSFIYVNNPEYITNKDIVDDRKSNSDKLFEQANVFGANTFYQTNLAWYNPDGNIEDYPSMDSFYMGIDFYNPNNYAVNIDVNNLTATENKTHLSKYINKQGNNVGVITVQPYAHAQLFDYTPDKFVCHKQGDLPSLFIVFDFEVKKATGANIPDGQGITVSTLAAYDYENMRLKNGEENILVYNNMYINNGAMVYGDNVRPTEHDLEIKYKGIARNQSNQIDANLDFVIDDNTYGNVPFKLKDSGELIDGYYPHPQTDWNVQINPISDEYESLLHTTVNNLHKFKYRFSDSKT